METAGAVPYIRGGGGIAVDGRRLGRVAGVLGSAAVIVLVALLARAGVYQELRAGRLRADGVGVRVTVTGCVGLASGTGITTTGYTCRGAFLLGGHRYEEVVHGSTARHDVGDAVTAVAVPGDPATLTAETSVHAQDPPWRPFVAPGALLFAWASAVAVWLVARSRNRGVSNPAGLGGRPELPPANQRPSTRAEAAPREPSRRARALHTAARAPAADRT